MKFQIDSSSTSLPVAIEHGAIPYHFSMDYATPNALPVRKTLRMLFLGKFLSICEGEWLAQMALLGSKDGEYVVRWSRTDWNSFDGPDFSILLCVRAGGERESHCPSDLKAVCTLGLNPRT